MYCKLVTVAATLSVLPHVSQAATFDMSLLSDGETVPSFTTAFYPNAFDAPVIGSGSFVIADDLIVPDAYISFASGGVEDFSATIVDDLGVSMTFEIPGDPNVTSGRVGSFPAAEWGVLFDENGDFLRIDRLGAEDSTPGLAIADDETPLVRPFSVGPFLAIQDFRPDTWSILLEAATIGTEEYRAGDYVLTELVSDYATMPVPNFFRVENSEKDNFASGPLLVTRREDGGPVDPGEGEGPTPPVVPLPASVWMLLGAMGGLKILRHVKSA